MSIGREISDMWDGGWSGKGMLALMIGAFLLIPVAIVGAINESEEWDKFSVSHHCKVTEKVKASSNIGFGVGGNGKVGTMVITTPSKTAYLCDDGVTYWR